MKIQDFFLLVLFKDFKVYLSLDCCQSQSALFKFEVNNSVLK